MGLGLGLFQVGVSYGSGLGHGLGLGFKVIFWATANGKVWVRIKHIYTNSGVQRCRTLKFGV